MLALGSPGFALGLPAFVLGLPGFLNINMLVSARVGGLEQCVWGLEQPGLLIDILNVYVS